MKTALFLILVVIATPYCNSASIAEETTSTTTKRDQVETQNDESSETAIEINAQTVEIMSGRKDDCQGQPGPAGQQGIQGPQGLSGGGALYTRWGRTDCPSTNGTERIYEGLAAGTHYNYYGGGANHLCITKTPEYRSTSTAGSSSLLYGAEYRGAIMNSLGSSQNVPCAVCHTSERSSKLMIPGRLSCPTSWTEEYDGYLMTGHYNQKHSSMFECVDGDAKAVSGLSGTTYGALFYHVGAKCGVGLPCSPFVTNRVITCVVCTK